MTSLARPGTVPVMSSRKHVDPERPIGVPQIIRRFGWTNNQFEGYRRHTSATDPATDVPPPDWPVVGAGPAWRLSTIDGWARYRAKWNDKGTFDPVMSWLEACEPQPRKAPAKTPAKRTPRRT